MIFTSVVFYSTEDNKELYLEDKKKSFATQLCLYEFYFFYLYDEIELVVKFQISSKKFMISIVDCYRKSRIYLIYKNLILSTPDFNRIIVIIEIVSFICIVPLRKLSSTTYNIS